MDIFHVVGKPYLTILVSKVVQMVENLFYAMFVFWQKSMYISKDVYY
jgi:hypothetical protein